MSRTPPAPARPINPDFEPTYRALLRRAETFDVPDLDAPYWKHYAWLHRVAGILLNCLPDVQDEIGRRDRKLARVRADSTFELYHDDPAFQAALRSCNEAREHQARLHGTIDLICHILPWLDADMDRECAGLKDSFYLGLDALRKLQGLAHRSIEKSARPEPVRATDALKQELPDDLQLANAADKWLDIARDHVDDIRSWRSTPHLYDWRRLDGNLFTLTAFVLTGFALNLPNDDTRHIVEIAEHVGRWHLQRNAEGLPESDALEARLDSAALTVIRLRDMLIKRHQTRATATTQAKDAPPSPVKKKASKGGRPRLTKERVDFRREVVEAWDEARESPAKVQLKDFLNGWNKEKRNQKRQISQKDVDRFQAYFRTNKYRGK